MGQMGHFSLLLLASLCSPLTARQELLLVLDQTVCWNCSQPAGCRQDVAGAEQTVQAVNWTMQRLDQLNLVDRETYRLETLDTCSQEKEAQWEIVRSLGQLAAQERINLSQPLHLVLASHLNTELESQISGLPATISSISPTSSTSLARSTARMVTSMDWRKVAVLSDSEFSHLLGLELAREDVCVLDIDSVPTILDSKDSYTRLLSELAEVGVDKLVVGADGADIVRLVKNIYQLNLNMSVLAVPWDGSVSDLPASDLDKVEIIQLVQTFSNLPDFTASAGLQVENVRSWEVVRSLYGLLVLGDVGVDEDTVREGLQLQRERPEYSVERLDRSGWRSVAVMEAGTLRWTGRAPVVRSEESESCESCQCLNGVSRPAPVWRHEVWVTVLVTVAALGIVSCLLVCFYLCTQCGQVLEGSQATTFSLLSATVILFVSVLPFCFLPHSLVCALRELAPPLVSCLVVSMMVSRSLLLATADTDGLPGHASGALQVILGLLLLGVEVAVVVVLALTRGETHTFTVTVRQGRAASLQCSHSGWSWLVTMVWPGLLLILQLLLSPAIWRSRRNYREGALFSLASLALSLVTAGWLAVYLVCTELYGDHWEDISTAAGLVASGTTIILVIFIPKVYMMNMWGRGSEISLHLPDTATSTLHTDTIDYVRGTDIYKMSDDSEVLYDNNPGNRRALSQILGKYNSYKAPLYSDRTSLPLGVVGLPGLNTANNGSTYKLDSNTEPDHNISWEPFLGTGSRNTPNGVSPMFISNMTGYGYTQDLSQDNFTKYNPSTNL